MGLMSNVFLSIFERSTQALAKGKQSSALNPLIWICVTIPLACFYFANTTSKPNLEIAFMVIGCGLLFLFAYCFIYFMTNNPDYLRSERFQIQKISTELMGAKGQELQTTADHLVAINQPENKEQKP